MNDRTVERRAAQRYQSSEFIAGLNRAKSSRRDRLRDHSLNPERDLNHETTNQQRDRHRIDHAQDRAGNSNTTNPTGVVGCR
jgi:hypothetical protein